MSYSVEAWSRLPQVVPALLQENSDAPNRHRNLSRAVECVGAFWSSPPGAPRHSAAAVHSINLQPTRETGRAIFRDPIFKRL